ncbi:MAG: hypothetical protein ACTS73_08100 [Arsenophonus sp. NEOnobi-MAG3]
MSCDVKKSLFTNKLGKLVSKNFNRGDHTGKMGISMAYVLAACRYKFTFTILETISLERRKLLKALGANLVLTEGSKVKA